MKNIKITSLVIFVMLAVIGLQSYANDANQNSYVSLLNTYVDMTGSTNDIAAYKGNGTLVVDWGVGQGTTYTGTVTIASSATATGTFATITNTAGTAAVMTNIGLTTNEVDSYAIDLARVNKYIKATYAGVVGTNSVSVILVAPMKSQ